MIENDQVEAKKQAAFFALQSGSALTASRHLTELSKSLPYDVSVWMGLAVASMQLSDMEAADQAIDKALELQPRHFAILLLKADILQAVGNLRRAATFFQAALAMAPPESQRTDKMKAEVARAERMSAEALETYEALLRDNLTKEGFLTRAGDSRYDETVDMLFAKRKIYLQEPHDFYFPRLPQIQFYERSEFDWVPALEARTEEIAAEVAQVLDQAAGQFRPYLRSTGEPQMEDLNLMDNLDWSAYFLIEMGQVVEENAARCPATMEALESLPLCRVADKMPSVLFSVLQPKTRIVPHTGLFNTRLICHLPLIIPGNGYLRVGNETRHWRKGEMFIFDDSIEHEAFNGSDELRAVLIIEIWRPELSERDKEFLRAVFRSIDEKGEEAPGDQT